jgi:hypothetical protein
MYRLRTRALAAMLLMIGWTLHAEGAGATTISSTFDADLDGWTITSGSALSHMATGGNPGGFLFVDNDEGAIIVRAIAPAKFLGDLSSFNGGVLAFDGNLLTKGSVAFYPPYGQVTISSSGGTPVTLDLAPSDPPIGEWVHYSVSLDAATWGRTPQAWAQLLAGVTEISIVLEAVSGLETNGFDNFTLSSVPEPSVAALLGVALGAGALSARRSSPRR